MATITRVRNVHGIKVRKWCGSCQHRLPDCSGNRFCEHLQQYVEQDFVCKGWAMSEGMQNAGRGTGVVKDVFIKVILIK